MCPILDATCIRLCNYAFLFFVKNTGHSVASRYMWQWLCESAMCVIAQCVIAICVNACHGIAIARVRHKDRLLSILLCKILASIVPEKCAFCMTMPTGRWCLQRNNFIYEWLCLTILIIIQCGKAKISSQSLMSNMPNGMSFCPASAIHVKSCKVKMLAHFDGERQQAKVYLTFQTAKKKKINKINVNVYILIYFFRAETCRWKINKHPFKNEN